MHSSSAPPIELDVSRIRGLSERRQHREALVAAEALAVEAPKNRDLLYLVAVNQRCLNRVYEALETLRRLEQLHPRFSLLYQERGYCYTTLRDAPRAIQAFLRGVDINPALAKSWNMLERLFRITGDARNATAAAERLSSLKSLPPEVVRAGSLFSDGDLSAAENILRAYLRTSSDDVEALRLLGRIQHQRDVLDEAESLLEAARDVKPDYIAARLDYIRVLIDRQKYLRARQETDALLRLDPDNRDYLSLSAAASVGLGDYDQAITLYRELLVATPAAADLHVWRGHALQSLGQKTEAIESYHMAAAARPSFGDAWWSLANLKTYHFSQHAIVTMRAEEAAPTADPVDRYHLCFALGKALEDRSEFAESWQFYERGNALKRAESRYDPLTIETDTRQQVEVCTAPFFAARAGVGAPNPDPIFIVGLPRSGSTLIEQILASHSLIEGTRELADIPRTVVELRGRDDDRYPAVLTELAPERFRTLGERYITDTRAYRHGKPFFIDKMPNTSRHIGLIHLMLPNAKIIDVRRDPMACCVSNLKQLFAKGQEFTYSIDDIARYYRTYLELMRHWDAVLPGRVLRVWYEDVVENIGGNVRRILEFCGLEFEPGC